MFWVALIFTGLLTAAAGAVLAGVIAAGAVKWYSISSFEGASGYFVVAIGLVGLIVGLIIGLVCAGVSGADTVGHFIRGTGSALAITIVLAGVAAAMARGLADVPPRIDGQDLFLVVEVRCPRDQATSPANEPGDAYLLLGSIPPLSHTVRKHVRGPLWKEEATRVDGRWIVRGAVEIFTERGKRFLQVAMGDNKSEGFHVPLPRWPRRRHMQWSEWLPRAWNTGAPLPTYNYRFRVQRWSEPMKTESIGAFEVDTITRDFHHAFVDNRNRLESSDRFRVRHRGKAISVEVKGEKLDRFVLLATLAGEPPALLVRADRAPESGSAFFLISDGASDGAAGEAKVEFIAEGDGILPLVEYAPPPPRGNSFHIAPNRMALSPDGLYRVGWNGVFDTRDRRAYRFTTSERIYESNAVLIGVSPDRRSFVRFGVLAESSGTEIALAVTDFVADRTEIVRINRARMHFTTRSQIDRAWVEHHFAWERDGDGVDRLIERKDFSPLPYRGVLSTDYAGRQEYRLDCVGEAMRAAIEEVLVTKLGAERVAPEAMMEAATNYEHEFRIDGRGVAVACSEEFHYVMVRLEAGTDAARAKEILGVVEGEVGSGKYDGFVLGVLPTT